MLPFSVHNRRFSFHSNHLRHSNACAAHPVPGVIATGTTLFRVDFLWTSLCLCRFCPQGCSHALAASPSRLENQKSCSRQAALPVLPLRAKAFLPKKQEEMKGSWQSAKRTLLFYFRQGCTTLVLRGARLLPVVLYVFTI